VVDPAAPIVLAAPGAPPFASCTGEALAGLVLPVLAVLLKLPPGDPVGRLALG